MFPCLLVSIWNYNVSIIIYIFLTDPWLYSTKQKIHFDETELMFYVLSDYAAKYVDAIENCTSYNNGRLAILKSKRQLNIALDIHTSSGK